MLLWLLKKGWQRLGMIWGGGGGGRSGSSSFFC
jgi:hypothetical protein